MRADAVTLEWGLKIPMRDGSSLSATVYRPKRDGPVPGVFHEHGVDEAVLAGLEVLVEGREAQHDGTECERSTQGRLRGEE